MTTQEHQPTRETMQEKTLEVVHIIEEKSVETVLIVEKDVKPYEQLLIKCKDDWIHHLAQALSFSLLTNLVAIAILLLAIVHVIQVNLDKQAQQMLTGGLESIIPQPLSLPVGDVVNKAFDTLSHASAIAVFFIILPAILFGSFLFSLMESCFDVIYHLPPRPFVRRHLVAIVMLLLFAVLTPIIILASAAPSFILSLLNVVPPGHVVFRLASIAGSTIFSLILFQAIYVLVPYRHVTFQTLGRHIRNSWRGTLVSTVAMQLGLQLFPIYANSFLNSYVGQVGFVVIMLLFFYLFALVLLLGAEVNAFYAEGIHVPKSDLITQASNGGYE
ncbi:MAG: YihY/virulence factor BrkB family protein [Chloroflexi bacterium]|nr:MAG: YihY/virulence factor BrkB family protein [Chloroflexota bacterium]